MRKEEKYLIKICNAYLTKQNILLDESVDFSRLFSVSKEHNLVGVAFSVIKNSENKSIVPDTIYHNFENGFYETIFKYEQQEKVIEDLSNLLSNNKIRHIFFKGAQIRNYYPIPEVRAMGDIDILIDEVNREKVKQILTKNGFILVNSNGPVYDYNKDGVLIEMHTKIISGKVGSSSAQEGFKNAMDNGVYNGYQGTLNDEYHLAYLITHIAHHFWFYAAGIKMILDIAVFQQKHLLDTDKTIKFLKDVNLDKFAKVIFTLCYKWFGIGKSYDANTVKTEEFVTSFGAFGNAKRNKAVVVQRKQLEDGKKASPIFTRLRLLFPSYEKVKNIPYIKFIEGRPWLLPFAWIYRIYYNLKHRKQFVAQSNKKLGSKEINSKAQSELNYFKEIGLI